MASACVPEPHTVLVGTPQGIVRVSMRSLIMGLAAAAALLLLAGDADAGFRLPKGRLDNAKLQLLMHRHGATPAARRRRQLAQVKASGETAAAPAETGAQAQATGDSSSPAEPAAPVLCPGGDWLEVPSSLPEQSGVSGRASMGFGLQAQGSDALAPSDRPHAPSLNVSVASSMLRRPGAEGATWNVTRVCLLCAWGATPPSAGAGQIADANAPGRTCVDVPADADAASALDLLLVDGVSAPDSALRFSAASAPRVPSSSDAVESRAHPSGTCLQTSVARFGPDALATCMGRRAVITVDDAASGAGLPTGTLCDARGALKGSRGSQPVTKVSVTAVATTSFAGADSRDAPVASATLEVPVCAAAKEPETPPAAESGAGSDAKPKPKPKGKGKGKGRRTKRTSRK